MISTNALSYKSDFSWSLLYLTAQIADNNYFNNCNILDPLNRSFQGRGKGEGTIPLASFSRWIEGIISILPTFAKVVSNCA